MSDSSNQSDAIIERLDALIAAVDRLTVAITGSRTTASATKATPTTTTEPHAQSVAPDAAPAVADTQPSAEAPSAPMGGTMEVVVEEHVVTGIPAPGSDLRATLRRMFEAAMVPDKETAWRELTALTHPRELVAPRAIDSLKAFSWKQLRKNAERYLDGGAIDSFVVQRTDPAVVTGAEERVKVFLKADGRSPAPVTLRRDGEAAGAWRLGQVSL